MSAHLGSAAPVGKISPPTNSLRKLGAVSGQNKVLYSEYSDSEEDPLPGGHTTPPPPPSTDSEEELKLGGRPSKHHQHKPTVNSTMASVHLPHQLATEVPPPAVPETSVTPQLPIVTAEDVVDSLLMPGSSLDMPSLMDLSPTISKPVETLTMIQEPVIPSSVTPEPIAPLQEPVVEAPKPPEVTPPPQAIVEEPAAERAATPVSAPTPTVPEPIIEEPPSKSPSAVEPEKPVVEQQQPVEPLVESADPVKPPESLDSITPELKEEETPTPADEPAPAVVAAVATPNL